MSLGRRWVTARSNWFIALVALPMLLFAVACSSNTGSVASPTLTSLPSGSSPTGVTATNAKGTVSVLYAGSLVDLMENDLGPAFSKSTGLAYQGEGHGSTQDANMIRDKLRTPDVFISASPSANHLLMGTSTSDFVTWYAAVFGNQMVLGYNPQSKFATQLKAAAGDPTKVFKVLESSGFRLGRTDPSLDPAGYRTLFLFQLADTQYNLPGLSQQVLGDAENSSQIFAEEQMVARLQAGQLDAAFLYRNQAAEQGIPYLSFPASINLGDPADAGTYGQASWTDPSSNTTHQGDAIVYTVTIPTNAPNPAGAVAFVKYLMSADGQAILNKHGLPPLTPEVSGQTSSVPSELSALLGSG